MKESKGPRSFARMTVSRNCQVRPSASITYNWKEQRFAKSLPKRRRLDRRFKNRLYETVYDLNRGFNIVLEMFERLERQAIFRREYIRAFHNMADELRAKTNYELTATLRDREQREAAEFGRLCRKWERRFKSPKDAAILSKRQRRQQSTKKP